MITADNQDSISPRWWTLAQLLVWILQQVDLPPQDAEQFCNELNPKTIEMALNALVGALFNALYGAVEGLPVVAARVPCGPRYVDLTTLFQPPPSLESGALDALRDELRQFIRQQPDIQFNPTWGRWTWPVCVSAAQAAPAPTRPQQQQPVPKLSGKEWVPVAYARRPDELLAMGITGASEALATESSNAVDCAEPLTARYIENLLRELKAFPKAHRGSKQPPK
jgi:hypothetical protein